tara:strand:- start:1804 stop:3390 length:1587 start_codon:yes stop_codon:yes gene_type:complete
MAGHGTLQAAKHTFTNLTGAYIQASTVAPSGFDTDIVNATSLQLSHSYDGTRTNINYTGTTRGLSINSPYSDSVYANNNPYFNNWIGLDVNNAGGDRITGNRVAISYNGSYTIQNSTIGDWGLFDGTDYSQNKISSLKIHNNGNSADVRLDRYNAYGGNIYIDGQKWPNAAGSNGQYLKTDASGNLSWAGLSGSLGANFDGGGLYTVVNLPTPSASGDAASKGYVDSALSAVGGGGDVVDDTTPQLGGSLDVNSNSIVSVSNGNITLAPNGTGDVILSADTVQVGDTNVDADITTNGSGNLYLAPDGHAAGKTYIRINNATTTGNGNIYLQEGGPGNGNVYISGTKFPGGGGSEDQVLTFKTVGGVSTALWVNPQHESLADDTTPQLGANLDVNGNSIVSTSNGNVVIAPNGVGQIDLNGKTRFNTCYIEDINILTSATTISVDALLAPIHTVALNTDATFTFANMSAGMTTTVIITQGASGGTGTFTSVKFPGGIAPTLGVGVGSIDLISVFYDGTNYLGNVAGNLY